ncbi:MAG TPA: deaminase [Candidatus Paceibacterota bacterium]|nr:deaminase [Candidatus Paceibacterota bacterium]
MKTVIIAYIPVLHEGYRKLFASHPEAKEIFILGKDLIADFPHLAKDIRQLNPDEVKKALESWSLFDQVQILDEPALEKLKDEKIRIILPNEEVMKSLADKYLSKKEIIYSPLFLRWDKHKTVQETELRPDRISTAEFDREIMKLAEQEAEKSTDIWRRVGSILVKDKKILHQTHNEAVRGEHSPMYEGDPRNNFHKGVHLELSIFIHSEAKIIADLAREGTSTEGTDIYVTTFPCPPCAKVVACAGIKRVFYRSGYGVLDSEMIFKDKGIEIIRVD